MKETTLLKIALICSLIGLIALYFISARIDIKDYKPNVFNRNIGDDVNLKGTITKISDKGNVVFIDVSQQNSVPVVLFRDNDNLNLKKGDNVEVIGKVQEYNGKPEIVANKVMVVR